MPGDSTGGPFEVAVEPRNDQYDPDDDRWRDQVATLHNDLHAHVDTVRRASPATGTKGAVDQFVIALGSAGAFQAAMECFRAWLARDRDRRIDVSWQESGVSHSVSLTGSGVDADTVQEIASAVVHRVGGPPWPAGTGLS